MRSGSTWSPRPGSCPADHLDLALAAIEGGAGAVQLRAPELEDTGILPLAADLAVRCRARGVLFVVNDRLEVALEGGADGRPHGPGGRPVGRAGASAGAACSG